MNKKILVVGVILLFIGMSISSSTGFDALEQSNIVTSNGKTLYVGGSGPGNYSKIQDAIDNASDGDTVFVYEGGSPYRETIEINVSIHLIGENKNTTIIGEIFGINILKDHVLINGFCIRGAIFTFNISQLTITDNHIYSILGIFLICSSDIIIARNLIQKSWGGGVQLLDCRINQIVNNTFKDNVIGISIYPKSNKNLIVDNIIMESEEFGLYLDTSFYNIIRKNNFIKNNHSIRLINSSFNLLLKNYWDDWKFNLPRPINGTRYSFLLKKTMDWIFFDWHPAQEPYDIEV